MIYTYTNVSYNKSVQITKINHPGRQKMDMDVSPIKYYEYKKNHSVGRPDELIGAEG